VTKLIHAVADMYYGSGYGRRERDEDDASIPRVRDSYREKRVRCTQSVGMMRIEARENANRLAALADEMLQDEKEDDRAQMHGDLIAEVLSFIAVLVKQYKY
jgi:hypothetical protein